MENKYWILTITTDGDGDFSYKDIEFGNENRTSVYLYENPADALLPILSSYMSFVRTFKPKDSDGLLKDFIPKFKFFMVYLAEHIIKNRHDVSPFSIDIPMGNGHVYYEFTYVETEAMDRYKSKVKKYEGYDNLWCDFPEWLMTNGIKLPESDI